MARLPRRAAGPRGGEKNRPRAVALALGADGTEDPQTARRTAVLVADHQEDGARLVAMATPSPADRQAVPLPRPAG